jgi:sec-independent protein translocase protein TatB
MFDLSWTEILIIGTAAIIFIGPKELPSALRTLGQWTSKARALANDFRSNVDEMIRESEIDKLKTQVDQFGAGTGDLSRSIEKAVDPKGEITSAFTPPEFSLEAPKPATAPSEASAALPPPAPETSATPAPDALPPAKPVP